MYTIDVNFEEQETPPVVLRKVAAGKTLLEVCLENNIELPHECGGACSCKTCHIYVTGGEQFLMSKSKREMDFLARINAANKNSRLSCQSILSDGKGKLTIIIPIPLPSPKSH